MKSQGTVVRWDEARGFGFIRTGGPGADVFLHARDLRLPDGQRPREGLRVVFDVIHVGGKGPRAVAVRLTGGGGATRPAARPPAPRRRASPSRPGALAWLAWPLMAAYGAALAWAAWTRLAPWWILPAAAGLSLAAFFVYWQDKYAAEQGRWRIPEDTLHLWSLAGGWPGAWLAQQVLRHKSSKGSFLTVYWATVLLHLAGVGAWLWVVRGTA
jgi:uncharacterized membrane protein YsdA (DUF1294 family)/cold shock CspA family protein